MAKEPCRATAESHEDGVYATCEKTRTHLIHKDGDLKFVGLPGGILTNGKESPGPGTRRDPGPVISATTTKEHHMASEPRTAEQQAEINDLQDAIHRSMIAADESAAQNASGH